ncbi:phage major capsid protein [Clostridium botulinum]|nr:phage major capsid protein [Clostridium botulinum]NFO40907.1 phage major capsid protein [Clostridium botulinum]
MEEEKKMNKLKKLQEKRAIIITEMEESNENRAFDVFEAKELELQKVDREINAEKRMLELKKNKNINTDHIEDEENEVDEIRNAIENNDELDLRELEVRTITIGEVTEGNTSAGNIKKTTYADYILKKLPYISPLYGALRKEVLTSATHTIPVQKNKIGKFVKMNELQKYASQHADYNTVKVEPNKYGTLITFSEEVLEDLGYDLEAEMLSQLTEAYGATLDELIITGDASNKVQGLNAFSDDEDSHKVEQLTAGKITADELVDIFYSLPVQYRNNATWVISDSTARELSKLTYNDGTPVLFTGYNNAPVGQNSTILGKPVIINDYVSNLNEEGAGIFFGDLTKALVAAPRKAFTIKRSDEFGFIDDSVAIKANVRLDIKKTLGEAMAVYKTLAPVA